MEVTTETPYMLFVGKEPSVTPQKVTVAAPAAMPPVLVKTMLLPESTAVAVIPVTAPAVTAVTKLGGSWTVMTLPLANAEAVVKLTITLRFATAAKRSKVAMVSVAAETAPPSAGWPVCADIKSLVVLTLTPDAAFPAVGDPMVTPVRVTV